MTAPTFFPPSSAAGNAWTVRRSDDDVLQVYRAVANAGPNGIGKGALGQALGGITEEALTQHLQELRRKGHARYVTGPNNNIKAGTWVATPSPWPGELPPAWITQLVDADEFAPPPGTADAVLQQARQVPSSVFGLGLKIMGEVDIDALHRKQPPEAAAQADPPAAPAPAPEAATAPAAAPALAADAVADGEAQAQPAQDSQAEHPAPVDPVPVPPQAARPGPIVVALDNLGRLMVHEEPHDPVVLSPIATAALFGYLDRTCGGFLVDALP